METPLGRDLPGKIQIYFTQNRWGEPHSSEDITLRKTNEISLRSFVFFDFSKAFAQECDKVFFLLL